MHANVGAERSARKCRAHKSQYAEVFEGGDFDDYLDRLQSFFIAQNVGTVHADADAAAKREADMKKVAMTISVIGK
jgi:hypothetical protein